MVTGAKKTGDVRRKPAKNATATRANRSGTVALDELLVARVVGDDARFESMLSSGSAVRAATTAANPVRATKRQRKTRIRASGALLARSDGLQVVPIAQPRLIGYARVSTDEQTTRLQLDALLAAGCAAIHEDSASGVSRSRPGLSRALEDLVTGDTLVVWRLDRLGRPLRDLLDISDTALRPP